MVSHVTFGRWGCVLVAAAALAAGGALCAQETPRRITDIQVEGLQRVAREKVLAAIRLRPGDDFTAKAVDDDVRRIAALGWFLPTGINVRSEPHEDGVRLIFDLKERPVLRSLQFVGARALDESKLRDVVGLRAGDFVDVTRIRESTRAVQDLYREQRFQFVEVDREDRLNEADNTVDVVFTIKEGPKVALKGIRFDGNRAFDSNRLLQEMETRGPTVFGAQPFEDVQFRDDLVRIRQFYRRSGYLDAVVTGDYEYSPDKTSLTVVVRITEGEVYRVGNVTVEGIEQASPGELTKDFRLKTGAVFNGDDYDHDVQSIIHYYTARGHVDARVDPKESFPEPNVVDIVFVVTENRAAKMGLLEIRGNLKTKDKVIRREFDVYPGDPFNAARIETSVERLRSLGYFAKVETSVTRGEYPDERNLIVEVEEGRTGRVSFGAGVSSDAGLIGLFDLSLENFDITDWPRSWSDLFNGNAFVGGGQRLLVQLAPGSEWSQARLLFSDPRFLDTKVAFTSDLYVWTRQRESYDEGRAGVRITLARRFNERLSGRLTFRFDSVNISNLDLDAPPDVVAVEGRSNIYSVIAGVDYDRTDSRFSPSSGWHAGASVELAGGDFSFVKGQADAALYRTLYTRQDGRKHVLALTGRVGAVNAMGSDDSVPVFERFYAGGRTSLRGFSYRGASPRQVDTPVGGEFLALGSVEYFFPVYQSTYRGKPYEMVRGVLFADVGKVAYSLDDIGADKIRASVGVGVRLSIPALGRVPIAIDLGFPISKEDGDDEELFSFTLGAEF